MKDNNLSDSGRLDADSFVEEEVKGPIKSESPETAESTLRASAPNRESNARISTAFNPRQVFDFLDTLGQGAYG